LPGLTGRPSNRRSGSGDGLEPLAALGLRPDYFELVEVYCGY